MSGHCNVCGSLKIQETCYLCGSLNNNSMLEDGSIQDHRLHGFIMVPIPPPAFHTTLPHSPRPNVSPLSPSPAEGGSTSIRRCISDVLPAASPPTPRTGVFSYARGELLKPSSSPQFPHSPHPIFIPLSPSPAKSGYAELPPRPPIRRCISDVLPIASSPRTGVIFSSHGDMPTGSPVMTQESPDHERQKSIEIALKQVTERIKEMKQYCETVVLEAEGAEAHHNNTTEGSNADTEEKVSIERDGEYQFLFSGSDCYYKLM